MAPHEFVEIRLVCKADYLDPQLKIKLHEIKDKLREILHTGRRRFALKKVQPWNSVKVTFDIPKEAADRLRLLAVQGNVKLIELGILSVEIVGQSNAIVVNSDKNTNASGVNSTATNSKQLSAPSSTATTTSALPGKIESTISSSTTMNVTAQDAKIDERHRHKRVKLDNDAERSAYSTVNQTPNKDRSVNNQNPIQISSPTTTNPMVQPINSYIVAPSSSPLTHQPTTPSHVVNNNYVRISHPNSITPPHAGYLNNVQLSASSANSYSVPSNIDTNSVPNGMSNEMHNYSHSHSQQVYHQESWSIYTDPTNNYKMKMNGARSNHYYAQQQPMILSEVSSSSSPSNMFCTPVAPSQYDLRRCETTMTQMNASSTNLSNNYDGTSS